MGYQYMVLPIKVQQGLHLIQNKCLRACSGAFRPSTAMSLHAKVGILPLKKVRKAMSLKLFFKMQNNLESLTHQVIVGEA